MVKVCYRVPTWEDKGIKIMILIHFILLWYYMVLYTYTELYEYILVTLTLIFTCLKAKILKRAVFTSMNIICSVLKSHNKTVLYYNVLFI